MALLAVAILVSSSIYLTSPQRSAEKENVLVVGISVEPQGGNVAAAVESSADSEVISNMFDSLLRKDPSSGEPLPALATSWEISSDGLTYTFRLRKDVKFHDGTSFNASAVKVNFDTYREGKNIGTRVRLLRVISEVKVIDDYTVAVRTGTPVPYMLDLMAIPTISAIRSPSAVLKLGDEGFAKKPSGTGPFKFDHHTGGTEYVVVANTEYFLGRPKIDKIVWRVIPDPATLRLELEKGTVDYIDPFAAVPGDADALKGKKDIVVKEIPSWKSRFIEINNRKAPFNNVLVRRALSFAIDRDAIIKIALRGFGVVSDGAIPVNMFGHAPNLPKLNYDPVRAKELLAQAGYPNGFEANLIVTPGAPWPDVATVIQANLRDVGVKITLQPMETVAAYSFIYQNNTTYDMLLQGRGGIVDDGWLLLWELFYSQNIPNPNRFRYVNPEVDRLLDSARKVTDRSERLKLYYQIQEIITRDMPVVPLYYATGLMYYRSTITTLYVDPNLYTYFYYSTKTT